MLERRGERVVGKKTRYHFADGDPNGSIRVVSDQHVNTCPRAIKAIGQIAVHGYTLRVNTESQWERRSRSRRYTSREYSSYSKRTAILMTVARRCERIAHFRE